MNASRPNPRPPAQPNRGEGTLAIVERGLHRATNRERARHAARYICARLPLDTPPWMLNCVMDLAIGAGSTRGDPFYPFSEGIVSPHQGLRSLRVLSRMGASERRSVRTLLRRAQSPIERALLLKTIAAHGGDDSSDAFWVELRAYASTIRGRKTEWLLEHATAYRVGSRSGLGAMELGNCVPATTHMMWMENDPLEAMRVRTDPSAALAMHRTDLRNRGATLYADLARVTDPQRRRQLARSQPMALGKSINPPGKGAAVDFTKIRWLGENPGPDALQPLAVALRDGHDIPVRLVLNVPADATRVTHEQVTFHMVALVDVFVRHGERVWRVSDPAVDQPALESLVREYAGDAVGDTGRPGPLSPALLTALQADPRYPLAVRGQTYEVRDAELLGRWRDDGYVVDVYTPTPLWRVAHEREGYTGPPRP